MKNDYIKTPSRRRKRLKIGNFFSGLNTLFDQSVLKESVSADAYNFDFNSGALTDGFGVDYILPIVSSNCVNIWQFNRYDETAKAVDEIIVYCTSEGKIYYVRDTVKPLNVQMNGTINAVNYRLNGKDVIIFCSDLSDMVIWDGENAAYTVTGAPKVISMAVHFERLYAVTRGGQNIRFSDDLDPTNWNESLTEGGYIELADERGRINRIIGFLNYLYIFREYGISRLAAYGDQTEFSITNLFVSSGRIYPETIAVCGDTVIFLAEDGLYRFDGLSTSRILENLDGYILPDANAAAGFYNGRYYLCCKLKTGADVVGCESEVHINNGLIVYEAESKNYYVTRGINATAFAAAGGKPLVICGGSVGQVIKSSASFRLPLKKKWQSPFTDFGTEKNKLLQDMYFATRGGISLTVKADGEEKSFDLAGKDDVQRVRINMRGERFSFKMESENVGSHITAPTIILTEL